MYKVLVVDDEILVREAISAKVEWNQLGFELAGDCENGRDAIAFLKSTPVSVVLTDICMPYIDGMKLSKYIYENFPQIIVIIFSGYSDFEYAKQAIQYKVSEYMLKPVTKQELSEVLAKVREKLDHEYKQKQKIDELTKVYRNYTKHEALVVARILSRLVRGLQEVSENLNELEELGISISGAAYRVAVVEIDVYSELYEIDDNMKKESALMSFAVENIADEIIARHTEGLAFRDSDNRVNMLFYADRKKAFSSEVKVVCDEIQGHVYEAMKLSTSIGIGAYVDNLEELSKSYDSAVDILKNRYTKGKGKIYDCENIPAVANPLELEQDFKDIVSSLIQKDETSLQDTLDHVENWMKSGYIGRNKVVAYLHQILRIIYETVRKTEETFTLATTDIASITEARSMEKAMTKVRSYALRGLRVLCEAGKSSAERFATTAIHYLKDHYNDSDLGVNQICDYLNISTSRFSSVFKEETGMTFTEMLTNIRMERAKELLKQTSLKNYEIAEKVGFSDPHYFSIVFKKMTGKTPKEYAREK